MEGSCRQAELGDHGQVNAEGFIRETANFFNFLPEVFRCFETFGGYKTDAPGVADRGHDFRPADPLHAPANDGMLDTQHLCDFGFEFFCHAAILPLSLDE